MIVCLDGGERADRDLIRSICAAHPSRMATCLHRNRGQQHATLVGIELAGAPVIVTMDDDGAHPPDVVPRLVAAIAAGADLAYAVPTIAHGISPLRRAGTAINRTVFRLALGAPRGTRVSSFRAFSRDLYVRARRRPVTWPYLSALLLSARPRVVSLRYRRPALAATGSRYSLRRLIATQLAILFHWGPLRGVARSVRPARRLDVLAGCVE